MSSHKDLHIWQKGIELVKQIYQITGNFPTNEQYGMVSQMRRSAVSIPSNIAEGCGRNSSKELVQFLYITLGSAAELETQIIISKELNYIDTPCAESLIEKNSEIIKMTAALIKSIKTRPYEQINKPS